MMRRVFILVTGLFLAGAANGGNPIVPGQGLNDPHVRIFNDTAYLYATHDKSASHDGFVMEDWWVWSSRDLVNWKKESVLSPGDTWIGEPFDSAWATDAAHRNGKYYWYFSEGNRQTGVVVGDTPVGPWHDPLGEPLLPEDLTPTHEYDISIFEEQGQFYAVFGVWDYYIARLADDMISLAEKPRKIEVINPRGPYGEGLTDDKPFVHKRGDRYYLSWGAFYAMSDRVYGPYSYVDTVMKKDSFAPGYKEPTWPYGFLQGRHGSYFEWNNQSYFAYCDMSQSKSRYFRDTFISYVHYRENGEIAPIRVDGIGVGQYDAGQSVIEAEDYFSSSGMKKVENPEGGFMVKLEGATGHLGFPHVSGLNSRSTIRFRIQTARPTTFTIQARAGDAEGQLLSSGEFRTEKQNPFSSYSKFNEFELDIANENDTQSFHFVFKEEGSQGSLFVDSLSFR